MHRNLILALLSLLAASAIAQPKLQISGADYDFGMVPQNSVAVNYFWFKSVGKDTVRIQQIKTGCDCATMMLSRGSIAPGDSMRVGLFWDTQRKIGTTGKYPFIFVDGIVDPLRMSMKAFVVDRGDSTAPLSLKPFRAELSRMPGTSIDSIAIQFTNRGTSAMALAAVAGYQPEFTFSLPDSLAPGQSRFGFVKINSQFADQEFRNALTIEWKNSDGQTGRFTLPVRRKLFG
jgi:hypothetical protein